MPKRKNARAAAAKKKLYMQQKRESLSNCSDADMGKAKPLATGQASPHLSEKMSGSNAPGLEAPTGGRLSTTTSGMPASSDSQIRECTGQTVPWPYEDSMLSGLAGQSKLVTTQPISIIEDTGALLDDKLREKLDDKLRKNKNVTTTKLRYENTYKNKTEHLNKSTKQTTELSANNTEPMNEKMNDELCIAEQTLGLQGNFHQGNTMFGRNAGSQCVANCLSAVSYSCIKDVSMWGPKDMDNILVSGDELYSFLRMNLAPTENYLLIHELPTELENFDTRFKYTYRESIASMIQFDQSNVDLADFNALPLNEALQISLMESHAAFVCFGGNTMLIGKSNGHFFAFDSHSRSLSGMFTINGKSCCVRLHTITDVFSHLKSLASSMGYRSNVLCEVTGVLCDCNAADQMVTVSTEELQGGNEDLSETVDMTNMNDIYQSPEINIVQSELAASNTENEYEVEIVSETAATTNFVPLTAASQQLLCKNLNITCSANEAKAKVMKFNAEKPKQCINIEADGNCFFRALSYSLCESEENFHPTRQKVCHHILMHGNLFNGLLRNSNDDVEKYIKASNMTRDGTWATEVEIFAAAHMLKTDIYTYSQGRWLKYSGKSIENSISLLPQSIYLNHINANHYEVVLDVLTNDKNVSESDHTELEGEMKSSFRFSKEWRTRNIKQRKLQLRREEMHVSKPLSVTNKRKYKQIYKENSEFRRKILKMKKQTYNEHKEIIKQKYQDDEKYRDKLRSASLQRYRDDEKHRAHVLRAAKQRYRSDAVFQDDRRQASKHKYSDDANHRDKKKLASKHKYRDDTQHREGKILASKHKYMENEGHRNVVRQASKRKYREFEVHRDAVRQASKRKYREDEVHRDAVRQASKRKYREDEVHGDAVRQASKRKYREDEVHGDAVRQSSKRKYREDENFREHVKNSSRHNYQEKKEKKLKLQQDENFMIKSFKSKTCMGPTCICCCCHRLLFENQVVRCNREHYLDKPTGKCISQKYFHTTCTNECPQNCTQNRLWICKTCQRKINADEIPAEASVNNMCLEEIPEQLKNLNRLEQHLIARHIPFMKVMALPQGGQHCLHGPVVCVPSEIRKVSTLPRAENENLLLKVKLKRKIAYKGHYEYNFVNTQHVMEALKFLKRNNEWYRDLIIDSSWENTLSMENQTENENCMMTNKDELDEQINVEQSEGVQFETCLQPVDVGQEVLDHHFDEIYNLAPSEGKNPVKLLQEKGNEAKTFPTHFPSGTNTWNDTRETKISLSRYFNNRLMNADSRFAKDTDYIFFSQYLSELNQVIEKTQISLRKSSKESQSGSLHSKKAIQDPEILKKLFNDDEAFRFLQPIRGTPAYWQSAQKDLFAMLRQLGIPTWFCSFSAAEFRWTEIIQTILDQQRDNRQAENLNWTEKSEILRSNPVTVARMVDHRFHIFLSEVILSPAEPIGKVIDYFFRVEFQQRGSPHMHCLFWIENAPKLETHSMETVCEFIDKYVTCEIPSEEKDSDLRQIVQEVQQHSKKHSKSCKKKGTECRFNFPRPLSSKTFISTPDENDNDDKQQTANENVANMNENNEMCNIKSVTKEEAESIIKKVWERVLDEKCTISSAAELLDDLNISQTQYEEALNLLTAKQKIVLKRNVNEMWTNQYNPQLLKCWNANMDIQYILDPFSCIVYVLSYISKSEREMGMLLKQTKLEAQEGNLHARQTLKKIGSAYLNHREVGAQEAVYRVCNLKMKECSRKVVFIPIGDNPTRLSKPLSQIKKKLCDDETEGDEEIWMTNIVERYQARPTNEVFDRMCLATFCSEYRVLAKSQIPKTKTEGVYKLQNDKGYIQKRTHTQPAVIRFPKFSIEKNPEKHFQSILQLFLPYRSDLQLKPPGYNLYQTFYETGHVKFTNDNTLQAVKEVVDSNNNMYSSFENVIENAKEVYEQCGEPEDAWSMLCPETEVSRKECILEKEKKQPQTTNNDNIIPDIEDDDSRFDDVMHFVQQHDLRRNEALHLIRTLNDKQRNVFYFVRDWALKVKEGQNPDPFHIFITGGAGTGKSHLIKTLNYEATRLLSHVCSKPDDMTVLLTAFTGTAAFNISGCTIHHAFSLNKSLPLPYEPLKEQSLNAVRAKLKDVKILVIDEVSMVYKRLLYYIHERLVQIKGDKRPFGGVSVIAVGDFYQLPPVKQRKDERLFRENFSYPIDYWKTLFEIVELDEVMRQRTDQPFAQILNTLRTRTSDMPLIAEAKQMLTQCVNEGQDETLHVYSTNEEVNSYNHIMLQKQCSNLVEINAKDYQRDKNTGKMLLRDKPFPQTNKDGLHTCLLLAVNARVMLTRNIDVADGLVNGVMGKITDIIYNEAKSEVKTIQVTFDHANVGKLQGKKMEKVKNAVFIERVQEELCRKTAPKSIRHQFPLKLSWACTAHKVQGMTVSKVVVNLDRIFSPGQAYVALSRVTSQEGLSIEINNMESFEKKIYADPEVKTALQDMKQFCSSEDLCDGGTLTVFLHNVQSLKNNIDNIRSETRIQKADLMCFTETWLKSSKEDSETSIENFRLKHVPRSSSYNEENEYFARLKHSNGGGVSVYIKESSDFQLVQCPVENLEAIIVQSKQPNVIIATIYRPPSYIKSKFISNLQNLLSFLRSKSKATLVIGDFNEDLKGLSTQIFNFFSVNGFKQLVNFPTTEGGTVLDHVYCTTNDHFTVKYVPTFYSYHEAIQIGIGNQQL